MGHTSIKSTGAFISRLNSDPWTSLKFARFSRLKQLAVAFLRRFVFKLGGLGGGLLLLLLLLLKTS